MGPNERLYAATIFVDGFTSAMSTVAFVAFISYFTSHTYTGTQYALLASIGTLGRTLVSGASGFIVDALHGNWALFFVLTSLMVIPSLILLIYVGRLLKERIRYWEAEGGGGQVSGAAPSPGIGAERAPRRRRARPGLNAPIALTAHGLPPSVPNEPPSPIVISPARAALLRNRPTFPAVQSVPGFRGARRQRNRQCRSGVQSSGGGCGGLDGLGRARFRVGGKPGRGPGRRAGAGRALPPG